MNEIRWLYVKNPYKMTRIVFSVIWCLPARVKSMILFRMLPTYTSVIYIVS